MEEIEDERIKKGQSVIVRYEFENGKEERYFKKATEALNKL